MIAHLGDEDVTQKRILVEDGSRRSRHGSRVIGGHPIHPIPLSSGTRARVRGVLADGLILRSGHTGGRPTRRVTLRPWWRLAASGRFIRKTRLRGGHGSWRRSRHRPVIGERLQCGPDVGHFG